MLIVWQRQKGKSAQLGRHELCVFFPWLLLLNLDCSHLEPWATIIKHANNFCDFNSHLNSAACVEVCVCVCVSDSLFLYCCGFHKLCCYFSAVFGFLAHQNRRDSNAEQAENKFMNRKNANLHTIKCTLSTIHYSLWAATLLSKLQTFVRRNSDKWLKIC